MGIPGPTGVRGPRPFWSRALFSLGHVVTPDLSRPGGGSGAVGPVRWGRTQGSVSSLGRSYGQLHESCHSKREYPSPEVPTGKDTHHSVDNNISII